jgi:hypothetical protein
MGYLQIGGALFAIGGFSYIATICFAVVIGILHPDSDRRADCLDIIKVLVRPLRLQGTNPARNPTSEDPQRIDDKNRN